MWQSDSFNIKLFNDIIIFFPVCWEVSLECWLGRSSLPWGSEAKSQVNLTVKLISARGPLPGLSRGLAEGSAEGFRITGSWPIKASECFLWCPLCLHFSLFSLKVSFPVEKKLDKDVVQWMEQTSNQKQTHNFYLKGNKRVYSGIKYEWIFG